MATEQEILNRIEEVKKQLNAITELKKQLRTRFWDNSEICEDIHGYKLSAENILLRAEQLADQLVNKYPNELPVLVGLMDGAQPFFSLLQTALIKRNYAFEYTNMQVSSYHGTESGSLHIACPPKTNLANRLAIVIDDVCDTGKTVEKVKKLFEEEYAAKKVELMVLVDKKQPRAIDPEFVGFTVSKDAFIIGYGLDYDGLVRDTDCIKVMNLDMLPSIEEKENLGREKELSAQLKQAMQQLKELRTANQEFSSSKASQLGIFSSTTADAATTTLAIPTI